MTVAADAVEAASTCCFDSGSCGVHVLDDPGGGVRLRAYFDGQRDGAALSAEVEGRLRHAGLSVRLDLGRQVEQDWNQEWRRHYQPVWATRRIAVHPPWLPVQVGDGQIAIAIDPAMAFGTGGHESTQLALAALEVTGCQRARCLDVGTGSGVLAIAAMRLGAAQVTAVDVDPVAVDNARRNLSDNLGASARGVRVLLGSLDAVADERFDVIVANIEGHLMRPLLAGMAAALAPGGIALLSGLLVAERDRFEAWLAGEGLRVLDGRSKSGWWSCRARAGPRTAGASG